MYRRDVYRRDEYIEEKYIGEKTAGDDVYKLSMHSEYLRIYILAK